MSLLLAKSARNMDNGFAIRTWNETVSKLSKKRFGRLRSHLLISQAVRKHVMLSLVLSPTAVCEIAFFGLNPALASSNCCQQNEVPYGFNQKRRV